MPIGKGKRALITGISGQDGSYLAEILVGHGYQVLGTTRAGATSVRVGGAAGADVDVVPLDLRSQESVSELVQRFLPDEIYAMAARSSSAQLFDDPLATADVNGSSVARFLEAMRHHHPTARFCHASSSEVFALSGVSPQDESTPLRPRNAYGAAKAFGQLLIDAYRAQYGLFACSAILFNHESPRRGENYVTRKITSTVARIAAGSGERLKLGSLDSRRDWGFAGDYATAMWQMLQHKHAQDYVLATGEAHSVSEFCEIAFKHVGLDYREFVSIDPAFVRGAESTVLLGDATRARECLGWSVRVSFEALVKMMVDADVQALASANKI